MSPTHLFTTAPYPGLRPFETEECDIFFGREKQTDELLQRLQRERFLAILGPSGCGKSSLIRAGLLAAVESGFMSDAGSRWRTIWMRPGDRPIGRLVDSLMAPAILGSQRGERPDAPLFLEAALRRGPRGLIEIVQESALCEGANLLVIVDQFEELFRFRAQGDPEEADAFVALLLATAAEQALPVYVIISMRSDFLGDCSLFRGLPEAINASPYLIPRLTREQCAVAIAGPARVFNGEIDPPLVNRLLNDFGPDPDQLPLLQHALMRMWQQRSTATEDADARITLTVADYEAIGGLAQALSDHADEAFFELTEEQQGIAKTIFQRLTERGLGKRDTRAPARLAEIARVAGVSTAAVAEVVDAFRRPDRSFLTPREGPLADDTLLDIGHESLIRQWKRLAGWVDEEAESAAMYARVRETARLWNDGQAGLWGNPDLGRALQWRQHVNPSEGWADRYGSSDDFALAMKFLDASEAEQRAREIEAERSRERSLRAARRLAWTFGAALAFLAVAGLAYWYLMVREHVSFYNAFTKINGAPTGIGRLTRAQVARRAWSIKLVRKGRNGRVIRMEAVNNKGEPTRRHGIGTYFPNSAVPLQVQPVRWEIVYDIHDRNRVAYEVAYDKREKVIWTFVYSPERARSANRRGPDIRLAQYVAADGYPLQTKGYGGGFVEIEYSPEGYEALFLYRNLLRQPRTGHDKAYGRRQTFDAEGRLIQMISIGPKREPMTDAAGNAGLRFTLDELGNAIRAVSTDERGKIAAVVDGWSQTTLKYDDNGNLIEIACFDEENRPTVVTDGYHRISKSYDDHGNFTDERYWDIQGKPTTNIQTHCHGLQFAYDDHGNLVRRTCIGVDNRPGPDNQGVTTQKLIYDDDDNLVESAFLDRASRPAVSENGYSRAKYKYDLHGNQIEEIFLGASGLPIDIQGGYARRVSTYDHWDNETSHAFYNANGQPVDIPDEAGRSSYARLTKQYDEYGNQVRTAYYDAVGKPALRADGYAGWTSRFDIAGNQIESMYFGTNGKPVNCKDGYAGWRTQYDEFGRKTREEYFQTGGEIVAAKEGIAGWASTYDARGNEIVRSFFDTEGRPAIIGASGYASWRAVYDDRRKKIETAYFGIDGRRTVTNEGYHCMRSRYDDRGREIETAYFDVDLKPMLHPEYGCAATRGRYNDHGKIIETELLGTDGKLIKGVTGYARAVFAFNLRDEMTSDEYFGPSGERVLVAPGYAIRRARFDDRGNRTHVAYYGVDGKPTVVAADNELLGGYSSWSTKYDDRGNAVEFTFFGANGERVVNSSGYSRETRSYNSRGQQTESATFDVNDRLAFNSDNYARLVMAYDARGNRTGISAFGADGRLSTAKYGYAGLTWKYDDRGNQIEEAVIGADGKPATYADTTISRIVWKFDRNGNRSETAYYGVRGTREETAGGFARVVQEFDANRRARSSRLFDRRNALIRTTKYTYDDWGNRIAIAHFDRSGRPMRGPDPSGKQLCTRWSGTYDVAGKLTSSRCE